jgi:hypothetical protein
MFSPNLKLQITRRFRNPDRLAESGQTAPVANFNINREAPLLLFSTSLATLLYGLVYPFLILIQQYTQHYGILAVWWLSGRECTNLL